MQRNSQITVEYHLAHSEVVNSAQNDIWIIFIGFETELLIVVLIVVLEHPYGV